MDARAMLKMIHVIFSNFIHYQATRSVQKWYSITIAITITKNSNHFPFELLQKRNINSHHKVNTKCIRPVSIQMPQKTHHQT